MERFLSKEEVQEYNEGKFDAYTHKPVKGTLEWNEDYYYILYPGTGSFLIEKVHKDPGKATADWVDQQVVEELIKIAKQDSV